MPVLRRPHAHCRGLCARHRTARSPVLRPRHPNRNPMRLATTSLRHPLAGAPPFSTSRHYYPSDCELSCDTTAGSQIKMSSAAAPTNSRPPAPICSQRRRPTPLPPKPLPNQIPIDREPLTSPRGFLLRRLSDAGPRHGCTNRRPAGIRNPSRKAVAGTRVDLRNPKLEWRADPPLYRGLRERCQTEAAWMPVLSRIRASHGGLN